MPKAIGLFLLLIVTATGCNGSTMPEESPLSPPDTPTGTFDSPISSPDLGQILFHSDRSGSFDLYLINVDGTGLQQLTDAPRDDVGGVWSPDGSQIAFASNREGEQNYEIYVIDADGGNERRLTDNPAKDWGPSWSADGSTIAFTSDRDGKRRIYVMDADGANQRVLEPVEENLGWAPAWSPVRNELLFVSDRDGDSEIYLFQIDEGSVQQLTFNELQDERPAWSPDGEQFVYLAAKEQTSVFNPEEIYIMSRSGEGRRQLTDNLEGDITPSWSPDGDWIAFSSSRQGSWDLYRLRSDGEGEAIQITSGEGWDRSPAWRP
jgi:TolB protein